MLQMAHDDHGETAWSELFQPAISLADQGLTISPRMAEQIADSAPQLAVDDNARAYFLNPDGSPKTAGTTLTNPAMSKTLSAIATDGADAFYTGAIAANIIEAQATTTGGRTPGQMTLDDLAGYEAKKRTALCTDYREHEVCGMPNPSSGGIAVASTLGILSNFDLSTMGPTDVDLNGGKPTAEAVHLISEAERLAYADRDKYVADSDFVPLPGNSPDMLLDPEYLKQRAALIDPNRSMGTAQPGDFGPVPLSPQSQDREHGTSHISVVDQYGNAAAMTTTVESAFGSFHMVDGFVLNNQLTDFSAQPTGPDGAPLANRVEPGKRPRSSMSPTLVFVANDGERGDLAYVAGSPGGSVIIQFVVKTLVNMLDWDLDPQQAVSGVDFGAANSPTTNFGGEHPNVDAANDGANDPVVQQLRQMGHQVSVAPQASGLTAIQVVDVGLVGGADPRREGAVMGDVSTGWVGKVAALLLAAGAGRRFGGPKALAVLGKRPIGAGRRRRSAPRRMRPRRRRDRRPRRRGGGVAAGHGDRRARRRVGAGHGRVAAGGVGGGHGHIGRVGARAPGRSAGRRRRRRRPDALPRRPPRVRPGDLRRQARPPGAVRPHVVAGVGDDAARRPRRPRLPRRPRRPGHRGVRRHRDGARRRLPAHLTPPRAHFLPPSPGILRRVSAHSASGGP